MKVPFVGMTGWAVNSIAKAERNTVNIFIDLQFILGAKVIKFLFKILLTS